MKDLTQGSVAGHILAMALPMAVGLLVQTLYFMIDLYFVARLGDAALAGVGAAGNFMFAIMALTQMLGVGTLALIAHVVGARDREAANLVFNQSLVLAALCALLALTGGLGLASPYMRTLGANAATVAAGTTYLMWFVPGLALQFALVAMSSALRGTGIVQPTMVVQLVTVLINCVLAPVLIAGIGTGHPLGVAGAGLASTLSVAAGVALLSMYFGRLEKYVAFHHEQWRPRLATWGKILNIGLPAGGEFALMFIYTAVIYAVVRRFGAPAQAGLGVGLRLMQAVLLPAMAIAFAVAPVAGQNFGARNAARVRRTFRDGALMGGGLMLAVAVVCRFFAPGLVGFFTTDPAVVAVGVGFLRILVWNFVPSGLIFTCSGMFQALGYTWPSIISSATRLVTFVLPALWLSQQTWFRIEHTWYLSVATVAVQMLTSLWLVRGELRDRLQFAA
ncbi:MAG TPA: MATE family efflux transporter [Steroidobacteraceae bacterium]|nr:MATE family efflux transporter [Steroidobacteraceae bacterium]